MKHALFIGFLFLCGLGWSQSKKPAPQKKPVQPAAQKVDSVPLIEEPDPPRREFAVYTKRPKNKTQRMKLCLNLLNGDSILNYCMHDSLLRDPEASKILFQKQVGDTNYVLVYASAFTKDPEEPQCNSGKETKLYFLRWNTASNKAIVRQRYIESCYRTITRLSSEKIEDWDGSSPLTISYNRGAKFIDLTFDPQNYLRGFQSSNEQDAK